MDIRKWLEETVLPECPPSPSLPEQMGLAPFLYSKASEKGPKQGRRRKRSTSDSSLIHARTARRRSPPVRQPADAVNSGDASACSNAYQPTHSSRGSTSSQQYARKPRRKTRPERYEPTLKDAKGRGKQENKHQKGESKHRKHKSRRNKAEKQGVGLVQSFHAKNVPTDRLTLKPQEKLGLFNKGRVSSPVKGRGLPDLVFSEMKFLQKHKDKAEAVSQAGLPKKKRKKDHAHAQQEEISAYFTSVRPALADKDVNTQAREGTHQQNLQQGANRARERSSLIDSAIPTIEAQEKAPYLGFGSRGPRHDSGSYISWSESIRAPSATSVRVRPRSGIKAGQLGSMHDRKEAGKTGAAAMLPLTTTPSVSRNLTSRSGDRFHLSSSAPASRRFSRLHSLPQRTCSPRQRVETARPPSSMPAAIPVQRERRCEESKATGAERVPEPPCIPHFSARPEQIMPPSGLSGEEINNSVDDNGDPRTSSTLGRLLQECNSAFDEQRCRQARSHRTSAIPPRPNTLQRNERRRVNSAQYGRIRSLPTVRFSGVQTFRPPVPHFAGPNIYEEQGRRNHQQSQAYVEEDETSLHETPGLGEGEEGSGSDELDYDYEEPGLMSSPRGTIGRRIRAGTLAEDLVGPADIEDDGESFPRRHSVIDSGFWRPNKLY